MKKYIAFAICLLGMNIFTHNTSAVFFITFYNQLLFSIGFGACWNMIAGLSGYYSFGHALYAGVGSYLMAFGLMYTNIPYVLILLGVIIISGAIGGFIGFISTRFDVEHAYFTLLTIAFLECSRIFFEVVPWFGATAGLFLTGKYIHPLIHEFFSWGLSLIVFGIILFSAYLYNSPLGYDCRALKDNKNAARSLGISPIHGPVSVMILSTMLTGLLGIFYVFYQKSLFPDQIFSMQRSMNVTLSPLIGGVGTIWGPVIGSLFILPLGELIDFCLDFFDLDMPGVKQMIFGCILLFIIFKLPEGLCKKKNIMTFFQNKKYFLKN